jgi:hypothetical protein
MTKKKDEELVLGEDEQALEVLASLMGNRGARTSMWATAETKIESYKIQAGSSVSLTCNQDEATIKKAQHIAQAYAMEGLHDMMKALGAQLNEV